MTRLEEEASLRNLHHSSFQRIDVGTSRRGDEALQAEGGPSALALKHMALIRLHGRDNEKNLQRKTGVEEMRGVFTM